MMYRRRTCGLAALLLGGLLPGSSSAGDAPPRYPERAVTLVVGYAAGGATDTVARLIARSMSEDLGQSIVIENKSGASSNVGAESVARAKPDGYTLYVGTIANTINRTLFRELNYDFVEDFTPVGRIANITNVLVVNDNSPVKNLQEYIAFAKAHPGQLTCASSGIGSSIHLSCELFKMRTQSEILHVPYRGSGPAVSALLGGQVDSMFDNLPSSLPHIQAGKLRAIGVTSLATATVAPDIPTISEAGLPGFEMDSWFGLMAPAKTPPEVVARLNAGLNKALASPAVRKAYAELGYSAPDNNNSPESFGQLISAEIEKWGSVIRAAKLQVE
jgi:tripartite-type tricarboxylate transporter receptor subunit TctC